MEILKSGLALGAEVKELEAANQALTTENENLKEQLDLLNLKVAKMNMF